MTEKQLTRRIKTNPITTGIKKLLNLSLDRLRYN